MRRPSARPHRGYAAKRVMPLGPGPPTAPEHRPFPSDSLQSSPPWHSMAGGAVEQFSSQV
ncbi:Hypothetical protein MexAM1_META2p1022 (plasmid) [Methylorubrum extorquens AM1]|uniref:Uncharacterized protein n=1 Tax=Methylorubrum extorquens (strain ATCC 14718 / DSM 1338 / JCM 2805 / NCIMB 9133 / AM1) TaxID=272630 RepID=C5B5T2_METEA|nr:Hypothetical protein MexAM1_META2p1022 [Methylorubrum extorquens AM1]